MVDVIRQEGASRSIVKRVGEQAYVFKGENEYAAMTARDAAAASAAAAAESADDTAALAGSFNRALVLDIDPAIQAPPTLGWETTAGRWRREPNGWYQCSANGERPYYDTSGRLLGVLIEGAETFRSAPWHDAAAPHTISDPAYLSKTVGGDTIVYAGGHALPDIFGGTGKAVEITQSATANGIFNAVNVRGATVSGDVMRFEMLFSIAATTGVGGTISIRGALVSGAGTARAITLAYDSTGTVTGWSGTVPNINTFRYGYAPAAPRSDGSKCWFVWMEFLATGTGEMAPGFGLPTAITGRKVLVHDLRVLVNPQTAPKAVPVCAANKTFAADKIVTGIEQHVGALFHRLGRCRTKIIDGKLSVVDGTARSGPALPYENRITIVPTTEANDTPGILPNETQAIDFTPWLTPTNFSVVLGPGYYNQRFTVGTGFGCVNASITSAFKNDPALFGQLERVYTSASFITGNMTLDDLILNARASEITTQFEQVDLVSATALNRFHQIGSLSIQRSLLVSHPVTHSRARAEAQADENDDHRIYTGMNYLLTDGGAGVTCNLSGSHFWRWGRSFLFDVATQAGTLTVTADDCYHDQIWSDAWYWETGTYTITFHRNLFGRFTTLRSDLYQTRKEIEVDVGAGWQTMTAAGLTPASLPIGRIAHYYGTWDFGTSTLTEAPEPDRTIVVRSWDKGSTSGTVADKPNFQFHASGAVNANEDRLLTVGEVYVITQDAAPAPATPWVRLVADLGYWNGGGTYTSNANPAWSDSGTHSDAAQVNRTTCIIESMTANDCVLMGNAQGPFLTGNTTLTSTDSDIKSASFSRWIVISGQSWAFEFDYSKTPASLCSIANTLCLPQSTRFRYSDGSLPTLGIRAAGANNTIDLANVYVGYKTGITAVSGTSGGTITGTHTQVKIGEITAYNFVAPSGVPPIDAMLSSEWLDPFTYAVRDDIDPLDTDFRFTAYAEARTGIALNRTLELARGDHARWNAVKAQIGALHRPPDYVISVPASTAVDTTVLSGLQSSAWAPLYSGNEKGYFSLGAGNLKVAKALTGINQCWLLLTAQGETILVDIS